MALGFDIPDYKKIRIILDTDAACEADDPFAIVHALLSPKLLVQGIVAEHFNEEGSMQRSYEEIMTILHAMEMEVPVFKGQPGKMAEDEVPSEAVEFIRNEALREDTHPLYVLCQGAITNVALALKLYPEIKDKMRVIWIGTDGEAPRKAPFREFNAGNDLEAANLVLTSGVDLWLVPSLVYGTIHIGIAEIERRIKPCGAIGEHLYQQLIDYNMGPFAGWTQGESWSLGDSPAIALAINPACGKFKEIPAPVVAEDTSSEVDESRPIIRVYTEIDARYILEDMIAKLELHYK